MGYYKVCHLMCNRGSRRRKIKGIKNIFKEIMAENFPDLKEGKKMPSYRKNRGSKIRWAWRETHIKTYNWNGKS